MLYLLLAVVDLSPAERYLAASLVCGSAERLYGQVWRKRASDRPAGAAARGAASGGAFGVAMTAVSGEPEAVAIDPAGPICRLRPSVRVSRTPHGIYVRGWTTACTINGGADVWRLWQRLEPLLRHGVVADRLGTSATRPATRRAVAKLVHALVEHDMTLAAPIRWWYSAALRPPPGTVAWLDQISADPAATWRRMSAAPVVVTGTGAVADAAEAAVAAVGLPVSRQERTAGRPSADPPRATAEPHTTVAVGAGEHRGFVAEPMPAAAPDGRESAGRIADRLGIIRRRRGDRTARGAGGRRRRGAADPSGRRAERPVPSVRGSPCRTARRRLVADGSGRHRTAAARRVPPVGVGESGAGVPGRRLRRRPAAVDALCDVELGALPPPDSELLPQLPVALATCTATGQPVLGIGTTTDAARMDAVLRTAERLLEPGSVGRLAVGADRRHADGILLRRVAYELAGAATGADGDHGWRADPTARRWWTALTVRFGVPARCTVVRLGAGAFAATVHGSGTVLGWSVEASPGDAAALAAFQATAAEQARLAGMPGADGPMTTCGATPVPPAPPGAAGFWTTGAVRRQGDRQVEYGLQRSLRGIVPTSRHPRCATGPGGGSFSDVVRAAGLERAGGGRPCGLTNSAFRCTAESRSPAGGEE